MSIGTVVIKEHKVSNQRALPIAYKLTLGMYVYVRVKQIKRWSSTQ